MQLCGTMRGTWLIRIHLGFIEPTSSGPRMPFDKSLQGMYDIYMASNSVARAPNGSNISRQSGDSSDISHDEVRRACARLLAQGFHAKQVSQAMLSRLTPNGNERSAYQKLRRWMNKDAAFRDLIFQEAVVSLDLKAPLILGGVAKKAMDGRVDAARLALEITGRHTTHEAPVTNVAIVLNNIPRPERGDS